MRPGMARLAVLLTAVLLLAGCATKVTRIEPDEVRDLSGRWNDSDSRLVAEAMIADCLNHPWLDDFTRRSGRKPDLIVGQVRNRSSEHISSETFTKELERAVLNSGKAQFVASAAEREGVRDERREQDLNAAPETRKPQGMEAGADFMLIGTLNSILDREGKEAIVFYQVDLELIDMTSNRKVWIGEKKIKKYVERARYKL